MFNSINKIKRVFIFILSLIIITHSLVLNSYAVWGEKDNKKFWLGSDGSLAKDGWKLIDDDNDGIGYYYYFDDSGFVVTDDIAPDYSVIGLDGRKIGYDGNPVSEEIKELVLEGVTDASLLSPEIMEQVKAEQDASMQVNKGFVSSGAVLYAKDSTVTEGPTPADNIVIEANPDGTARTYIGPNIVLTDKSRKKTGVASDPTISKNMQDHIISGDKYSKKVNGTTCNKQKWKEVMALKGTGATITFENQNNNFNKLKGRIATHNFSYSDRTTICTLFIYNDDDGEELYTTSDFNYNSGISFECSFPKKTKSIRFELEVSGQYTSRVCYLRNCEFGFDREAYEEEMYEDDVEREYIRRIGTASEVEYDEEAEDELYAQGEIALEGEDPGARYNRINNIVTDDEYWANYQYDEEDDGITAEMKASISEAKKRMEEKANKRDEISGPNFDPELQKQTEAVGPDGSSRFVTGKDEGGE